MLKLIFLAALLQPQPPPEQAPNQAPNLPLAQAVASIDKGTLTIARVQPVCGYGMGDGEIWLQTPEKKAGEKVSVKAKVSRMMVTVVEVPSHVVDAFTVEGKSIPSAKLAELLAKERTVVVATDGRKPDAFHLRLYREDTVVLVPSASIPFLSTPERAPGGYVPPPEKRPETPPSNKDT